MAVIASTSLKGVLGAQTLTVTTLGASDTLPYDANKKQALLLLNQTAGSLTATIDGDGGTTIPVDGLGSVNVAAGLQIVVAASEVRMVMLNTIRHYCQGVVTVTGASGLKAVIVEV